MINKYIDALSIRTRFVLLFTLVLVGVATLALVSLVNLRTEMLAERSAKLVDIIDGEMSVVKHFQQLQQEGKLTVEQAKQQALDSVRAFRYEGGNYLFIYNTDGVRLLLADKPETEGKNHIDTKDGTGKYFIKEFINVAKNQGSGFVSYMFPKPGQKEALLKLSYVSYFSEWNWVLGTGVYMDDVNNKYASFLWFDIGLCILLLGCVGAITLLMSRNLLSQLGGEPKYAAEVVTQVALGDLTIRANLLANDKTSLLAKLQTMVDELRQLLMQVRNASGSIDMAATEIAQGNMDLSERTENQSASLEETASSMNQLTSIVKQNSENALQANQLANAASKVAVHGGDVVKNVVITMDSIKASSSKIVDIISVIDGIAFQTNILALNAAVEAARAGEQGRGFAVVASEVRTLAQRSAAAAREIKGLIQDSVEKIQSGSSLVDDAGNAMTEIVNSVKRVTDIMGEIAQASKEQSHGIEQVNNAIVEMEGVTQQNAALVEQAAAAAQSMSDQSRSLVESVDSFRLE